MLGVKAAAAAGPPSPRPNCGETEEEDGEEEEEEERGGAPLLLGRGVMVRGPVVGRGVPGRNSPPLSGSVLIPA